MVPETHWWSPLVGGGDVGGRDNSIASRVAILSRGLPNLPLKQTGASLPACQS